MRKTIVIALLLLTGCASTAEQQAKMAEYRRTVPTCIGPADCQAKWQTAQIWVARNAGYKIQISNDSLIETFNAVGGDTALAARVIKQPIGNGRYRIEVDAWCDNIFGCTPDAWDAVINFNRTVNAARP